MHQQMSEYHVGKDELDWSLAVRLTCNVFFGSCYTGCH
jgi:hypothetical protein